MSRAGAFRIVKWLFVVAIMDLAGCLIFILSYPRWYFMIPAVLVIIKAHIMFAAVNARLPKDAGFKEIFKAYMPREEFYNQDVNAFRKLMVHTVRFNRLSYMDTVIFVIAFILSIVVAILIKQDVDDNLAIGSFICLIVMLLILGLFQITILFPSAFASVILFIKKAFSNK